MKIIHQRKKCIGCGVCAAVCPLYFRMVDDGKSTLLNGKKVKDDFELEISKETKELKEAAESCPVQCIKIR